MKRSTLTLSILTAILLTACGGSDDHSDHTADAGQKPPKTTVPTTGNDHTTPTTPTTGTDATEDEGTSGTAADKTDAKKDDKEETAGDSGHGGGHSEPSADEKLKAAEQAVKAAEALVVTATEDENKAQILASGLEEQHKEALKKWDALKNSSSSNEAEIAEALKNADALDAQLKKATAALKAAKAAKEAAQEAAQEAKNQQELAELDVEIEKANHPVEKKFKKAEKDALKAQQASTKATENATKAQMALETAKEEAEKAKKEAEKAKEEAETAKDDLVFAGATAQLAARFAETHPDDEDAKKVAEEAKKAAEEAKKVAEEAKKVAEEAQAKAEKAQKKAEEAEKAKEEAEKAEKEAKKAKEEAEKAKEEAKEANKYRSVAGSTKLSDANFVEIVKVKKDGEKWLLTFAGDEDATTIDPNQLKTNIGSAGASSYGKFNIVKENKIAIGASSGNSVYGYIANSSNDEYKFFSTGEVSDPDTLSGQATYNGKALLKENGEKGREMVANVEGTASFKTSSFKGSFSQFQNVEPSDNTLTETEDKELLKGVPFKANIKGNKFIPSADGEPNQAKVYGHFYGSGGAEVGGLVEHEKFHGSFGGKKEDATTSTSTP